MSLLLLIEAWEKKALLTLEKKDRLLYNPVTLRRAQMEEHMYMIGPLIVMSISLIVAVAAAVSIRNQKRRTISGYVQAVDRWAQAALENKFWRSLAGKEPMTTRALRRFIEDLTAQKNHLFAKGTKAHLSDLWFTERSEVISGMLKYCCEKRHAYNPEESAAHAYRWLNLFVSGRVYECSWYYGDKGDWVYLENVEGGEFRCYTWLLTKSFLVKLLRFYQKGLSAVLVKVPQYPEEAIRQLGDRRLPETYKLWSKLHSNQIDRELELARQTLDTLRGYEKDSEVRKLIARYERIIEEVEAKTASTATVGEVVGEANHLLQHFEKQEVVRQAMERLSAVVITQQAIAELDEAIQVEG